MSDPVLKTSLPDEAADGNASDRVADEELVLSGSHNAVAIKGRLKRAIEAGVYADGDQLPPERQLAVAFSAARSTIRKALDELEASGLVVRRVGSGTFVNYAGPLQSPLDDVTDLISPLQLIEARLSVEIHMTRLAAINATARDLDDLEVTLERLDGCGADKDAFTRWDREFHALLARSSRNPLMVHIYQQVNAVRSHGQWDAMKELVLTPQQIAHYNVEHRAIYDALRQRDVQGAEKWIRAHLETARQDLMGAHSG